MFLEFKCSGPDDGAAVRVVESIVDARKCEIRLPVPRVERAVVACLTDLLRSR